MAIALYRRYRPESFADVIGQEHVTEPLMQALRSGRVNHAYLFSGPRGCGKTTSARILARCLNCEQGPTPTPCGTCESCVALARGGSGSVDVIEIDAASHGGVDDARDLRERASYGPAQSRFKVYIIDEAHMVTPQGFNALLKIVEEPPEHVKFVFATTEPEKVIGTIRSRTHHYPFRLVPPAKLVDYLERLLEQEGVAAAPGVLSFVTRAGGGSVRDSLSVLDQLIAGSGPEGLTYESAVALLGFTDAELLDATIDALAAADGGATFRQVDKVIESGHDPRRFVEDLLERLRDLIIVAAVPEGVGQVLRGVSEDQLERMRVQQAAFGPGALSRAADIVNTGLTEMTGANSPRLQLELICARVLLPAASGEEGYAARLDRLERRLEVGGVPTGGRAAVPQPPDQARRPDPPSADPDRAFMQAAGAPAGVAPAAAGAPTAAGAPAAAAAPVSTSAAAPVAEEASAPSGSGGMDTDAIRRAWPDVLGRIFGMRRLTWTFVSQNAQVTAFDGQTLTLGIATEGLTTTFRAGNHADVVRQALIDELGVEATVNGVHLPEDGGRQSAVAPPPGAVPPAHGDRSAPNDGVAASFSPPTDRAEWVAVSAPAPPWATDEAPSSGSPATQPAAATTRPSAAAGTAVGVGQADGAADPAPTDPAPTDPASTDRASTDPAPTDPAPIDRAPTDTAVRGASAVRASFAQARSAPTRSSEPPSSAVETDDWGASADDEDIELSGDVGRGVIESVLGGRVIAELEG